MERYRTVSVSVSRKVLTINIFTFHSPLFTFSNKIRQHRAETALPTENHLAELLDGFPDVLGGDFHLGHIAVLEAGEGLADGAKL